jgi:hypothetical protein
VSNAGDFLNYGIEGLWSSRINYRAAKLPVVSIQTAIEHFAKHRLVTYSGIRSLLKNPNQEREFLDYYKRAKIQTIGFWACSEKLAAVGQLTEIERDALERLANLRNQLVHFHEEVNVADIRVVAFESIQIFPEAKKSITPDNTKLLG